MLDLTHLDARKENHAPFSTSQQPNLPIESTEYLKREMPFRSVEVKAQAIVVEPFAFFSPAHAIA